MLVLDNLIYRWQTSGGISTVWYELTKRIIANCDDYLFTEYAHSSEVNHLRSIEDIPVSRLRIYNDKLFMLKRYLPVTLDNISSPFIFHSSYYRTCKNNGAINIITVHDFTYELFRKGLAKQIHCYTKHKAIKDADYIVCISESTKHDLFKFIPNINPQKIHVIYNGVSNSFFQQSCNNDGYLLFVGSRGGYKNFDIAVECAAKSNMPLVICGSRLDAGEKKMLDNELHGNYVEKGFVSETELNNLYNNAFALVYPSSYEGFGIPVLEAQKAGCPVVAMNNSSLPEVIGDKRLLCDNKDINEFLYRLSLLKKTSFRREVVQKGVSHASLFSWDKTYNEYMSLYKEIESTIHNEL